MASPLRRRPPTTGGPDPAVPIGTGPRAPSMAEELAQAMTLPPAHLARYQQLSARGPEALQGWLSERSPETRQALLDHFAQPAGVPPAPMGPSAPPVAAQPPAPPMAQPPAVMAPPAMPSPLQRPGPVMGPRPPMGTPPQPRPMAQAPGSDLQRLQSGLAEQAQMRHKKRPMLR